MQPFKQQKILFIDLKGIFKSCNVFFILKWNIQRDVEKLE
jgi:hypothetical protein